MRPFNLFPFLGIFTAGLGALFAPPHAAAIVGYYNVPAQSNQFVPLAIQLTSSNDFINTTLTGITPSGLGARLWFWNGNGFDAPSVFTNNPSVGWVSNRSLPLGQGAILRAATNSTYTIVGEVPTGTRTNPFPAGFSLRSSFVPATETVDAMNLSAALAAGDGVLKWNTNIQIWQPHVYRGTPGDWKPSVPSFGVGECFFIVAAGSNNWVRTFFPAFAPSPGDPVLGITVLPDDPKARAAVLEQLAQASAAAPAPAAPPPAFAPGTNGQVLFANRFASLNAPVTNAAGALCTGASFFAALQYSADGTNWNWTESPVAPVDFTTGLGAGYFLGTNKIVPLLGNVWFRLGAWTGGATYDLALTNPAGQTGFSVPVLVNVPSIPVLPPATNGAPPPALLGGLAGFKLISNTMPSIAVQPVGTNIGSGTLPLLTVVAGGAGPFTYQWRFNGSNVNGGTSSNLTLTNFSVATAGDYTVVVGSGGFYVTSQVAVVSLTDFNLFAGLTIAGPLGAQYRVDYRNALSTNWQVLTNLTLTSNPTYFIDYASPALPRRFYRSVFLGP